MFPTILQLVTLSSMYGGRNEAQRELAACPELHSGGVGQDSHPSPTDSKAHIFGVGGSVSAWVSPAVRINPDWCSQSAWPHAGPDDRGSWRKSGPICPWGKSPRIPPKRVRPGAPGTGAPNPLWPGPNSS